VRGEVLGEARCFHGSAKDVANVLRAQGLA